MLLKIRILYEVNMAMGRTCTSWRWYFPRSCINTTTRLQHSSSTNNSHHRPVATPTASSTTTSVFSTTVNASQTPAELIGLPTSLVNPIAVKLSLPASKTGDFNTSDINRPVNFSILPVYTTVNLPTTPVAFQTNVHPTLNVFKTSVSTTALSKTPVIYTLDFPTTNVFSNTNVATNIPVSNTNVKYNTIFSSTNGNYNTSISSTTYSSKALHHTYCKSNLHQHATNNRPNLFHTTKAPHHSTKALYHTTKALFHTNKAPHRSTKALFHTTKLHLYHTSSTTNARGEVDNQDMAPETDHSSRPWEDIPGPRSLPFIGTLHHYLPGIGQYSFNRLHHSGLLKLQQYGPIVREEIVPGVKLLYLFDPKDIQEMYSKEGRYPMRRSHTALEKYRLDRPHMYNTGGLLPTNGERWWELRRRAQRVLSRVSCVQSRLPHVDQVCQDFTGILDQLRCPRTGAVDNFLDLERRLFLELTMVATLDVRAGCLDPTVSTNQEAESLMAAAHTSNSTILPTDNGLRLWRYFDTPVYRKLVHSQDTIYRIALKYVEAKEAEVQASEPEGPLSVLEYFLLESGMDKKDIVGIFCDTLLAGIDTGAFTLSYVLHHLACHPEKQDILAQEAQTLVKASGGQVTVRVVSEARYLKAVLRETYRLRPVSIGVGRIFHCDTVIGGYKVPKGTVVVTQNQVSCRQPQHFPDPDAFVPERWLTRRHNTNSDTHSTAATDCPTTTPHPYLVLPFGHGPRSCIGRRMAEQNLYAVLLQVVGRYHVGWAGGELDCISNLINEPDAPLAFTFTPRH